MFTGKYINTLTVIGISACASLSACSNNFEPQSYSDDSENFSFPIPSAITETRIDPNDLDLSVLVNGQNVPMMPSDNGNQTEDMPEDIKWTGTVAVPVGQTNQLSVRWSINLIDLATLDRVIDALTSDNNVIYLAGNYTYPDDDGDNYTNLQELNAIPPTEVDNSNSFPADDGQGDSEESAQTIYSEGDRGPAGGWVFYVAPNGLSGLEVAPQDHDGPLVRWHCDDETSPGAVGLVVSTGEQNSIKMLQECANTGFVDAAVVADTYELNGFTDWFLPSVEELSAIAVVVARYDPPLSDFGKNVSYWSSSERLSIDVAWAFDFLSGEGVSHSRSELLRVRPVRAF